MAQNSLNFQKVVKMVQSAAQIGQNWLKWPELNQSNKVVKMAQKEPNCRKVAKMAQSTQNGPNGQKWLIVAYTDLSWSKLSWVAHNGPGCCWNISARKFALYVKLYLVYEYWDNTSPTISSWHKVYTLGGQSRTGGEGGKVGCWLANVNSPSPLPLPLPLPLATPVELSWSHGAQLSPFMPSSVSAAAATFPPNWSLSPQIGRRKELTSESATLPLLRLWWS